MAEYDDDETVMDAARAFLRVARQLDDAGTSPSELLDAALDHLAAVMRTRGVEAPEVMAETEPRVEQSRTTAPYDAADELVWATRRLLDAQWEVAMCLVRLHPQQSPR